MSNGISRRTFIGGVGAGAAALAVVGPGALVGEAAKKPAVRIGSKGFTEENIAGYLYAELLQSAGIKVDTSHFGNQTAQQLNTELIHNEIDLYPEYTGTGLFDILDYKTLPSHNPHKIWQIVASKYKSKWDLIWLNPAPMDDANGFAVTKKTAKKYHLKTLADLGKESSKLRIQVLQECTTRNDCLLGLDSEYHAKFKSVTTFSTQTFLYKDIVDGSTDVIQVFTTDAQIHQYGLVVLTDNKNFFPPYQLSPVCRAQILKTYPKIKTELDKLAPHLTTHAFRKMNYAVVVGNKSAQSVARAFLKQHHLI